MVQKSVLLSMIAIAATVCRLFYPSSEYNLYRTEWFGAVVVILFVLPYTLFDIIYTPAVSRLLIFSIVLHKKLAVIKKRSSHNAIILQTHKKTPPTFFIPTLMEHSLCSK